MDSYRIQEVVKQYTEYDMIQAHTELPDFPDFRTRLLYAFLSHSPYAKSCQELYSLAASLAQMGLDTHDLVTDPDYTEDHSPRSRQLKVLAGDYFNSQFYRLLAKAGQVEITKHLAGAICEVNRLKTNLYLKMKHLKMTTEDYFEQSLHIRTQLYATFFQWMDGIASVHWPEILRSFARCELIVHEIERSKSPNRFRCGWAFWHLLQAGTKEEKAYLQVEEIDFLKIRPLMLKYKVTNQLLVMLERQLDEVSKQIKRLHSEKLTGDLYRFVEPFLRYASGPKVLEEI